MLINNRRVPIGCLGGKAVNHMSIGILEYIVFWPLVVTLLGAFTFSSIRGFWRHQRENRAIQRRIDALKVNHGEKT